MNRAERERETARRELVDVIQSLGYPREFGEAIAGSLGTEKTMRRMKGYLLAARPKSAEEIADEMLAIRSERDRWVEKKKMEYYNDKYYRMRRFEGFGDDGDE